MFVLSPSQLVHNFLAVPSSHSTHFPSVSANESSIYLSNKWTCSGKTFLNIWPPVYPWFVWILTFTSFLLLSKEVLTSHLCSLFGGKFEDFRLLKCSFISSHEAGSLDNGHHPLKKAGCRGNNYLWDRHRKLLAHTTPVCASRQVRPSTRVYGHGHSASSLHNQMQEL